MAGYNHYPGCTCPWCYGGYGGYSGGGWEVSIPPPDAPASWQYRDDDFCARSTCPKCGAEVFFVRHNGGSVWFDDLGPPWPKHSCFDDDFQADNFRAGLAAKSQGNPGTMFGVVIEASEIRGSVCMQISVTCSDGTTITDKFFARLDPKQLVGELIVVNRMADGEVRLHSFSHHAIRPIDLHSAETGPHPPGPETPGQIARNFRLLSRSCDGMLNVLAEGKAKGWEQSLNSAVRLLKSWHDRGISNRTFVGCATRKHYDEVLNLLRCLGEIILGLKDTIGFINTYLGRTSHAPADMDPSFQGIREKSLECTLLFAVIVSLWRELDCYRWENQALRPHMPTYFEVDCVYAKQDPWLHQIVNQSGGIEVSYATEILRRVYRIE